MGTKAAMRTIQVAYIGKRIGIYQSQDTEQISITKVNELR